MVHYRKDHITYSYNVDLKEDVVIIIHGIFEYATPETKFSQLPKHVPWSSNIQGSD